MGSQRTPDPPGFVTLLKEHLQEHHQTKEELASCIHDRMEELSGGRAPMTERDILDVLIGVIEREERLLRNSPLQMYFWWCCINRCLVGTNDAFKRLLWAKLLEFYR